ncbi:MAG: hypothetical protein C0490_20920 [Marivirga sp.]|nr:hypothetical protein [Marivirga sp.]
MKKSILLLSSFFVLQCSPADKKTSIQGTWKVDSICTYYNGFTFTRKDIAEEPILEYQEDGKLKMSKGNESRLFSFEITPHDTLYHRTVDQTVLEKFSIQEVNIDQLILRKDLSPVFKGINQQRYETRYYSKK